MISNIGSSQISTLLYKQDTCLFKTATPFKKNKKKLVWSKVLLHVYKGSPSMPFIHPPSQNWEAP